MNRGFSVTLQDADKQACVSLQMKLLTEQVIRKWADASIERSERLKERQ